MRALKNSLLRSVAMPVFEEPDKPKDPPATDDKKADPPAQTDEEKAAAKKAADDEFVAGALKKRDADAKAAADAEAAKAEKKAARAKELEAMSPEDRKKAEEADAATEAEEARLNTVPEDGKYDLRMPKGVTLDEALLSSVSEDFKAAGLTNGQAQGLADKFIAQMTAQQAEKAKKWAETVDGWAETARKDPEIGGDKWDGTVAAATRAIDKLGTPALKEYLNATAGGNNPELIRIFAKAGALIAEDEPADDPETPKPPKADRATILYPNDQPKKG